MRIESLAVPGLARIDGRGCVRKADEDDTPTAEIQQMLGDHVTRTAIVDAHQIMLRVLGVGHDRTIEQHDRDPCLVERAQDAAIHLVLGGRELDRCEEHARHAALDVLPAQAQRARLIGGCLGRRASPDQRMSARERGRHHALTDRLEDLGLAEIRDQKTEGLPKRGARALHEGAGSGDPLHQPGRLQLPHGAGDGDA